MVCLGKVDQDAGAALGTKLVRLFHPAESVRLELLLARHKLDILDLGVHQKITILGADGAIAAVDFARADVGQRRGKFDEAAVTVALVRHRFWSSFRHDSRTRH